MEELLLPGLHERHPGITPALGESFAEAACVCFSHHHAPPITLSLQNGSTIEARLVRFDLPDSRTRNAHANQIDAIEAGAYGVSLAAVESVTGLVAVRRAETLTGADWHIAPEGADAGDLESAIRLEVSGLNPGTSAEIRLRLLEKVSQAAHGNSNLPAIAAVVGFKALEVIISPLGPSS